MPLRVQKIKLITKMSSYKVLKNQIFFNNGYSIVPLRYEDRMSILKWRNEQLYHLRQDKPISKFDQENYFSSVVNKLFEQEQPRQLLFSFLHGKNCIGYGGLVHINWIDKNAEISFVMETKLEKEYFELYWVTFLKLLEKIAFKELFFNKIYTHAFDLRPHLYPILEKQNFVKENQYTDTNGNKVVIHSKHK